MSNNKDADEPSKLKEAAVDDTDEGDDGGGVCAFFKARKSRANLRKRTNNPLSASTRDSKKRKEEQPHDAIASTRSAVNSPLPLLLSFPLQIQMELKEAT